MERQQPVEMQYILSCPSSGGSEEERTDTLLLSRVKARAGQLLVWSKILKSHFTTGLSTGVAARWNIHWLCHWREINRFVFIKLIYSLHCPLLFYPQSNIRHKKCILSIWSASADTIRLKIWRCFSILKIYDIVNINNFQMIKRCRLGVLLGNLHNWF